jgi:DNA-binding transcriptional regulator YiaG
MKKAKPKPKPVAAAIEPMPGEVFKRSIEKIYGGPECQSAFARLIDVSDRTVRSWISGLYPVPRITALLVTLMLKHKTKPEDLQP